MLDAIEVNIERLGRHAQLIRVQLSDCVEHVEQGTVIVRDQLVQLVLADGQDFLDVLEEGVVLARRDHHAVAERSRVLLDAPLH